MKTSALSPDSTSGSPPPSSSSVAVVLPRPSSSSSSSANAADGAVCEEDANDDDMHGSGPAHIGVEAQLRFQKARIKALTSQLSSYVATMKELEASSFAAKKWAKEEVESNKKSSKTILDLKSAADKTAASLQSLKDENEALKLQVADLTRSLASSAKVNRAAEAEHSGREVRLSRALEECDKYKETLAKATAEARAVGQGGKKENDKLVSQIKSLERQRSELLTAFKKQMKLIEVLKKQKVHVEAAKLLSFTEEEFVKVLDWGA